MSLLDRFGPGRRAGLAKLSVALAALAVMLVLSRRWPSDHTVHVVLGDAAARAVEVRLRYADAPAAPREHPDDWQREVTFVYAVGKAPRIVNHQPRVAEGDYDLEIELGLADPPRGRRTVTLLRRVHLDDGTAQVDVASAVRDSLGEPTPTP